MEDILQKLHDCFKDKLNPVTVPAARGTHCLSVPTHLNLENNTHEEDKEEHKNGSINTSIGPKSSEQEEYQSVLKHLGPRMIVKVKLDQALTYQQWLDDKETPFVFTMLEPLAFCYKKKRKDRSSRDQNSPKDEFYEAKDALRGINLADFKINCYFKYPEHMSKFKYNLMSNLPEKKRDQKSLSKQTDSELAGSQEIYCAAKIYSNSFYDQDSPDSSAKIYITLQNSKIAGLKQLHFSDPETKTAQYTRLGMLEGIGSVIPLHRPPMVTYLTNCSWLAPPEVVKFPQNALKRIRGIQNLDFEEETGKNSEVPENQEPAKPKSKPAPKPEIDYNKYEF